MNNNNQPDEARLRHVIYLNGGSQTVAASSIAQGLRVIGYGLMAMAVSAVASMGILVTYWNAQ